MKPTPVINLSAVDIANVCGGSCFCYNKESKPISVSSIISDKLCGKWCCHTDGYVEGIVMWGIGSTATNAKDHITLCKPTQPAQYFQAKSLQQQIISEITDENYRLNYVINPGSM